MYQILLLFSLIYSVQVINCRILKSKAFTEARGENIFI